MEFYSVEREVRVYPNPVDEYLVIEYTLSDDEVGEVKIENATGIAIKRMPLQPHINKSVISMVDVQSGMYLFTVTIDGEDVNHGKIMVIH